MKSTDCEIKYLSTCNDTWNFNNNTGIILFGNMTSLKTCLCEIINKKIADITITSSTITLTNKIGHKKIKLENIKLEGIRILYKNGNLIDFFPEIFLTRDQTKVTYIININGFHDKIIQSFF